MTQLKPCPFCAGEAEIERVGDRRRSTLYACTQCGARLETGEERDHGERWNERYEPTARALEIVLSRLKLDDGTANALRYHLAMERRRQIK